MKQNDESLAKDPEHLDAIKANSAELAQLQAKEAAVQARYARIVNRQRESEALPINPERSPAYGVMQIDDKPVTSIRFERADRQGVQQFNVSYRLDNKTVTTLKALDADSLVDAVGGRNAKAIIAHRMAKGTLKGENLINAYGLSPQEKAQRADLKVIDINEALTRLNALRQREREQLGLNIEGKRRVDSQRETGMQRDVEARKTIEFNNNGLLAVPEKALDKPTAHALVQDDLAALSKIENKTERQLAANAIGHSASQQVAYQAELLLQNSDMAKEAAAAFMETWRRNAITPENSIAFNDRTQESPLNSHQPAPGTATEQDAEKPARQTAPTGTNQEMPATVSNRYLKINNQYYFQDKSLAFEDRGNTLKLETENQTVIRDALIIAETRNWQSISVSGSENFKQQVWREASLKGMEVAGYQATALDLAALNQAMALRDAKSQAGDKPPTQEEKPQNQRGRAQQSGDGVITGKLLEQGADHYKHDKKESQSYYAKVEVDGGETTFWGVDLERAIGESQTHVKIGDTIKIKNIGQELVTITVNKLDQNGKKVGQEQKEVNRNRWIVEKADSFDALLKQADPKQSEDKAVQKTTVANLKASGRDTLQEQADALRAGNEIERKVIEQMPQLAAALAVSKLGEKIAQQAKDTGALRSQAEVDTMVYLIREGLAAALEKGKPIKAPEIREQGQRAAIDANSILNDPKPPEIVKQLPQQDRAITR